MPFRLAGYRKVTNVPARTLAVLFLHSCERLGGREAVIGELLRVEPYPHRIRRGEDLDAANALHPPQFIENSSIGEIAQFQLRCLPGLGSDRNEHQETRSEEHTSELQSLMRISYAVFCLKKNTMNNTHTNN